mgnify:FL=1
MPNSELQKQEKLLELKTATPKNLAKYGHLIQSPLKLDNGNTPYYGEAVVTTPIPFLSNNDTNLTLATLNPRPMEVRWMEYHNKHTQTFIPMEGKPFVAVLGAPTCREPDGSWNSNAPDHPVLDEVEAFYFDGSCGLVLNIGTWHEFPFAIVKDTNVIVILTNETISDLKNIVGDEAEGGDLCKRDLQKRFDIIFKVNEEGINSSVK